MKKYFLSIALILASLNVYAYIPPYWMIMSRTADNHGKGLYIVDQDVIFPHGEESWIINERWIVQNEQSMRLEVTGRRQLKDQIRLTYVYQNGRRYFIDENGVKKSEKISDDFFEPYFHFRQSKIIKPMLVNQNIAPAASLKSELFKYSEKHPRPDPETYVRLSRTGGAVAYAIGTPTPVSSSEGYPGIWIEQDQFHVRKIRLASQVEVSADNYKAFNNGLWLPKDRAVMWASGSAKISLTSASSGSLSAAVKEALDSSSLNFGKNPELSRLLPADALIKEFYSRMR